MAFFRGDDGLLRLAIPACENEPLMSVQNFSDYVESLNDDYTADVLINNKAKTTSPDIDGTVVKYGNRFGIVIGGEFNPLIYRGLNNDLCFMPTSLRYELFDPNERIRHSVEWIKKQEFLRVIANTPYCLSNVVAGCISDDTYNINLESIAKLYNFVSDCIDVTRNIMVAYFYAYTYVDKDKNQVLPITDFSRYSPTLYIGNIKKLFYNTPETVKNMCFQPFIRAKVQKSISINSYKDYEWIKSLFVKTDLPKNPEIAEYVYDMFDGGKKLFPGDFAAKIAVQIRGDKKFPYDLFEKYCKVTETDIKWLKEQYIKLGYIFSYSARELPEDADYMINREIDEIIIPYMNEGKSFGIK